MVAMAVFLLCQSAWAGFQVPPRPDGPVADTADVLTPAQEQALQKKLVALQKSTGVSLVVATIPSLDGSDIKEASYDIASTWGIGSKDTHKGALFLISVAEARKAGPGAKGCGCLRIEVGSYLEGDLTDSATKKVLKKAGPIVVTGDFNKAANVAVDGISGLLSKSGGNEAVAGTRRGSSDAGTGGLIFLFVVLGAGVLIVLVMGISSARRSKRRRRFDDYVPDDIGSPSSEPRYTPTYTPRRSYSPPPRRTSSTSTSHSSDDDDDDDDDGAIAAAAILSSMASSSSRRSSYDDDDDDSFGGFGGFGSDDSSSFFDDGDFGGGGSDW